MVMLNGAPPAKAAPAEPAAKKDEPAAPAKATTPAGPPAKPVIPDLSGLEHCPDFNERFTLVNGRTRAIAYPNNGYNCSAEYSLIQKPWPANV
jgi:hypothetical protein